MLARLSHRISNLEQENEVLKRYLAALPADLETIMGLESEDARAERIDLLRKRVARLSGRIDSFVRG